ncbi:sodium:proton antiporter, partial [[Clostridium] innocuum]|nr:sodium:proton antiporter [[Clostridium] innocuum]
KGTPAALNEDSITGRAFIELAENVVKQTEKRNEEQAPTHIVEMKK